MKQRSAVPLTALLAALAFDVQSQESLPLAELDGQNGFVIGGAAANDFLGDALDLSSDFNNDGLADLLIGATGVDANGLENAGTAYLILGRRQGFPQFATPDALDAITFTGATEGDRLGIAVAGVGDFDGDGIVDLALGAEDANPTGVDDQGQSYLLRGPITDFAASFDVSLLDAFQGFTFTGTDPFDEAARVAKAGDINNDGLDDLLVGAPFTEAGQAYVIFGNDAVFLPDLTAADLNGSNGFVINGQAIFDSLGRSVNSAGDFNGDGIDDMVIGANGVDLDGEDQSGQAYVVFGSEQPFAAELNIATLDGVSGFTMQSVGLGEGVGINVSSAGDFNGDGRDDLIIGALGLNPVSLRQDGRVYVVFGTATTAPTVDLKLLDGSDGFVVNAEATGDLLGVASGSAGDVNGDGLDDILFSAQPGAGKTYVLFGSTEPFSGEFDLATLNGRNGLVLPGIDTTDRSGRVVAGGGDMNGDGLADIAISAFLTQPVQSAGEAYVVFGNAVPLALASSLPLAAVAEDVVDPAGTPITALRSLYYDEDSIGGIAIIGNAASGAEGQWEYAVDGSSWAPVETTLSDASALVLSPRSTLRFVPAAHYSGAPGALTARLWDGRWREPGEAVDITSAVDALGGFSDDDNLVDITVDILPVNDPPSFVAVDPPTVNEDPGGITVAGWSAFDAGPGESDQFALAYQVENISNPGLFSVLPTIGTLGNLVYNPAPDLSGTSTLDVRVVDNGGIANGGVDVSDFQTLTITVNAVNDAPRLLAENPPPVAEDSGAQIVTNWAALDAGAPDETGQQLTVVISDLENPDLFAQPPAVDQSGNLSYTPATGASGVSTFTVIASDNGGTGNGGVDQSQPQHFVITVQAKLLFANSFE